MAAVGWYRFEKRHACGRAWAKESWYTSPWVVEG